MSGTRTMHGPVSVQASTSAESNATASATRMFSQLNQVPPAPVDGHESHFVETLPLRPAPTPSQIQKQFELAEHPAVKILVTA